jgi:hypothetical protein
MLPIVWRDDTSGASVHSVPPRSHPDPALHRSATTSITATPHSGLSRQFHAAQSVADGPVNLRPERPYLI